MIGGVTLTLKELERLAGKRSPLVQHKGAWIELRPSDLKNAEKFCAADPPLSLDDALRLTASEGDTLMRMPVHRFEAGPEAPGGAGAIPPAKSTRSAGGTGRL